MASRMDLQNWKTPGAQDAAKRTYDSVKYALDRSPEVARYRPDVFLQGSYSNSTNTRGDSDVDIVVMMNSAYMPDTSRLSATDQLRYQANRTPATTTVEGLRSAVTNALVAHYGTVRVQARNKCIRVDKRDGYVDADVVPAQQHRLYLTYPQYASSSYIEGISIKPLTGERIVNYPKVHKKNGEAKNASCSQLYKPTVRQIKRLRRSAVDHGLLGPKDAPGYLLECMTYNIPTSLFGADDYLRVLQSLAWLKQFSPEELAEQFKSCDDIHWLFKTDPGKHNQYTAHRVIQTLWEHL